MAAPVPTPPPAEGRPRLPRTVWAVAVTSLFSDWSYEMLLPVLPFFLVYVLDAPIVTVGLIEGLAVLCQAVAQPVSSHFLRTAAARKPGGVAGYSITTAAHGALALTTGWPAVLGLRLTAWTGRGWRQPIKKTILANSTSRVVRGLVYGLEQAFDSVGAVLGTACAIGLILEQGLATSARSIFAISVLPGLVAVLIFAVWVHERPTAGSPETARAARAPAAPLPRPFRWYLVAATLFGLGFFNILLAVLNIGESVQLTSPFGGGLSRTGAVVFALVVYLLYNLVYAVASVPAGRLADRRPRVGLIAVSYLLFLPVDLLLIVEAGLAGAVVLMLAAGVQIALLDVAESTWVSRAVPAEAAATAFGWFGVLRGVGSLVGSVVVGALWEYVSVASAFACSAAFVVAAVVVLVVAVPRATDPGRATAG